MIVKPTYEDLEQKVKALQGTEKCYHLLFDHSPDGIQIIDPATARFLDFNETAHLQLGYSREEFSKMSIFDLEVDETPEEIRSHMEYVIQHGRSDFETRQRTKQGKIINLQVTAQYTEVFGKLVYHVICRNITDRKQAERDLQESKRKLADIIDFLPDATFAIDLSGKVISWNRAMEEMSGVKAQDMLGKGDYEYALPFYGMRRPVLINLALKPSDEDQKRYSFIKKEGDVIFTEADVVVRDSPMVIWAEARPLFDGNNNIVGAIESISDITELKQAQKALQKAHDELDVRVRERTAELVAANKALQKEISERKQTEEELRKYREKLEIMVSERTSELEERTKSLQETNTALSVLLQKREEDRKILEDNFIKNIKGLVNPYLDEIRKNNLDVQQLFCLDTIKRHLEEIASPLLKTIEQFDLTAREIQVASLIRDGKATKEIAEILGIGRGSVNTHRNSIRKKLHLGRTLNLQTNLRFLEKTGKY